MNTQRWLGLALLLSLALNLLAAGALLGRAWRDVPPPPPMAWALRDLDPALREVLRPRLRERLDGAVRERRAVREAMSELRDAVRAEPLDRARASAALAALRAGSSGYQAVLHEALLDILARLPAERREEALRGFMHHGAGRLAPERRARIQPQLRRSEGM